MKAAQLIQVKSKHNKLRTATMIGEFNEKPTIGHGFVFFTAPLDHTTAYLRAIQTSEVLDVNKLENTYYFTTLNSTYELNEDIDT